MSGVAIVRDMLATNTNLLVFVPSSSIISGVLPLKTQLPAISISQISSVKRLTVGMDEESSLIKDRVQVTSVAKNYTQMKTILSLVREALPLSKGMTDNFYCDSILPDSEGPDIFDADALLHMGSQDFVVRYSR